MADMQQVIDHAAAVQDAHQLVSRRLQGCSVFVRQHTGAGFEAGLQAMGQHEALCTSSCDHEYTL